MTRSRLWRLRSMTQRMFSASATAWSAIASHTTPSSSSASPSRLMYRRSTLGLRIESGAGVRLGQGREVGGHGAQTHGAGREVDAVRVLRPAGVRLQPVEPPQRLQVLGSQVAQQVLDRVVDGRRVRLDGDPVAGAHVLEEQVRQDRHDRRARRLVAADLQVSGARPLVVGVVDHVDRQPEDAVLDLPEDAVAVRSCRRRPSPAWGPSVSPGVARGPLFTGPHVDADEYITNAPRAALCAAPRCVPLKQRRYSG